jgi:large subunit ribosomal protein L30
MSDAKVRVTLIKGLAGCKQSHRDTVRGLGLKRRHQTVELADSAAVRGMITKVYYLVRVEG